MTANERLTADREMAAAFLDRRRRSAVAVLASPDPTVMALRAAFKHIHETVAIKPGREARGWEDVMADIAAGIMAGEGD